MEVVDQVQYDIFRRLLPGICASYHTMDNQHVVDRATQLTNKAVERLLEMEVIKK